MAKPGVAALVLVLVAATAAVVAANSKHLRLQANTGYSTFVEAQRFSPLAQPVGQRKWTFDEKEAIEAVKDFAAKDRAGKEEDVGVAMLQAREVLSNSDRVKTAQADCKGVMVALEKLKNPTEMRFTLDRARNYGAATIAKLAEALQAQNARVRSAIFTVIDDSTPAATFFAPLQHNFNNAPYAAVGPLMPRVYDPRQTGRPLVVMVPEAEAAAYRTALHANANANDIPLLHVVGVLPRAADDEDQEEEASFVGSGFMRHAALTLMRALRSADNQLARAWLFDHDTVALAHKEAVGGSHGVVSTQAHWQLIEDHVAGFTDNDGVATWGQFVFHSPMRDATRTLATGAAVAAPFAVADPSERIFAGTEAKTLGNGALVNLAKLARGVASFPTAFSRGREDEALLELHKNAKMMACSVRNLNTFKTPLAVPQAVVVRPNPSPKFAVIDASAQVALFHFDGGPGPLSAVDFVARKVRAPCGEELLETAARALGDLALECVKGVDPDLRRKGFKEYTSRNTLARDHEVNLNEFFRLTATLHVVEDD